MTGGSWGEGDVVAVPLERGGWAAGVIARVGRRGTLLGYFSGRRWDQPPTAGDLAALSPDDSILVERFGDLGLLEGDWKVVGRLPGWSREAWPVPAFRREESLTSRFLRVTYQDLDDDPAEAEISEVEARGLPEDGLAGEGFVRKRLDRLLG